MSWVSFKIKPLKENKIRTDTSREGLSKHKAKTRKENDILILEKKGKILSISKTL